MSWDASIWFWRPVGLVNLIAAMAPSQDKVMDRAVANMAISATNFQGTGISQIPNTENTLPGFGELMKKKCQVRDYLLMNWLKPFTEVKLKD